MTDAGIAQPQKRIAVINGRVVLPYTVVERQALLIEDNKIIKSTPLQSKKTTPNLH